MSNGSIVIPKVWRSEIWGLLLFFVLLGAAVILSKRWPATVIDGEILTIAGFTSRLKLPLLWLLPFGWLSVLIFRIYNVRYIADSRGIEAQKGVLSFYLQTTRVRYEDVRSIETDQTLIGRILDVGLVDIGTAATSGVEMTLAGVGAPKSIQEFIQNERDRRIRVAGVPVRIRDQNEGTNG